MQLDFQNDSGSVSSTFFVDVILPLPLPNLYTYRVPLDFNDQVEVGKRIIVQFGKKRILTAIIYDVHEKPPQHYEAKYIIDILDEYPTYNSYQFKLAKWISNYYMCHLGEVFNASIPSGLKLHSESLVQLHPQYNAEEIDLTDKEMLVVNALIHRESASYDDIAKITEQKSVYALLKSLMKKNAIIIYEEIKEKYSPKVVKKIKISPELIDDISLLEEKLNALDKFPKQQNVLLKYLQLIPIFTQPEQNEQGILKAKLIEGDTSISSLKTLLKKGILVEEEEIISRFPKVEAEENYVISFSHAQQAAYTQIHDWYERKNIVLLHGVTGCGKTEIYIRLIQEVLDTGQQALYLLPEIALTTQIVTRLRRAFGHKMVVYHSKFSDNERVETWQSVQADECQLIVGVRSSIFLPFKELGLIIIDEEHESSYKQHDPAPRYNARDAALVLAHMHGAKTLLGSATPSLESYYQAQTGQWGFVKLTERFGNAQLPFIHIVNTRNDAKVAKTGFSSTLINTLKDSLANEEQAIIFQNRRGYAPFMLCEDCNHIQQCDNCNVSLTYHMYKDVLKCHYCGHTHRQTTACQACGSNKLKTLGHGTEKIEDDLSLLLPSARIKRMDLDTTRKKHSLQQLIDDFQAARFDILVGTQMVTKGLDFDHVNKVGIFNADNMLFYPDYRATENATQLMLQVSGRAGRREKQGHVYVQTGHPESPVFQWLKDHDYESFYVHELQERERYFYPPFCRVIKITVKHHDKNLAGKASFQTAQFIRLKLSHKRVLGPEAPVIDRIRNQYIQEIIIKIEREKINLSKVKQLIYQSIDIVKNNKEFKHTSFVLDVDPL